MNNTEIIPSIKIHLFLDQWPDFAFYLRNRFSTGDNRLTKSYMFMQLQKLLRVHVLFQSNLFIFRIQVRISVVYTRTHTYILVSEPSMTARM